MPARTIPSIPSKNSIVDAIRNVKNRYMTPQNEINVVSPGLCDDIIRRLAPSLSSHAGCTIIDINPGPGLLSSKIHELLKPQKHVLVEPIRDYHKPFLQPLADAPGSKYHLRDWDYIDAVRIQPYLDEGFLTSDQHGHGGLLAPTKPNNSILLIANMARAKVSNKEKGTRSKTSHFRALSFVNALRKGTELHSQGPIRMLMWLAEAEKTSILPRTVAMRKKTALQVESYFHVEEIVGNQKQLKLHREDRLDYESGKVVASRMKKAGINIPSNRQDDLQKEIQKATSNPGNEVLRISAELSRDWTREMQQLQEEFNEGKFSQFEGGPVGPEEVRREKKYRFSTFTPKFLRLRELRHNTTAISKERNEVEDLLQEEAKINTLDNELLHLKLDPEASRAKTIERDRIACSLQAKLESTPPKLIARFTFLGDDRRAFALEPPLLMWDRRRAEPLMAQDDEFYPNHSLALLDFQPKVPLQYQLTSKQATYFDYICLFLLHNGNQTLKSLAHAAPGAFEALTSQVPALRDLRKGGRRDLENFRVRNLTPEMVYELALAWDKWPFKPPDSDLMG